MALNTETGNGMLDGFNYDGPIYCDFCEKEITKGAIYFDDGFKIRCYSCWERYKESLDEEAYRINE